MIWDLRSLLLCIQQILTPFTVLGQAIFKFWLWNNKYVYSFWYISNKMQHYTVIYFWKTALHVSGGISTHHQKHTQLYLHYLVLVKPLLLPAALVEELELVWVWCGNCIDLFWCGCLQPHRPWGPPDLLYNGYRVSFPGVKRPGRGVDHPPSSSAEVKERLEVYL
jgi:hypothetical protein